MRAETIRQVVGSRSGVVRAPEEQSRLVPAHWRENGKGSARHPAEAATQEALMHVRVLERLRVTNKVWSPELQVVKEGAVTARGRRGAYSE